MPKLILGSDSDVVHVPLFFFIEFQNIIVFKIFYNLIIPRIAFVFIYCADENQHDKRSQIAYHVFDACYVCCYI